MDDRGPIQAFRKRDFYEHIRSLDEIKRAPLNAEQFPLDRISKKLESSVINSPDDPIPECTACGICCCFAAIVPISNDEASVVPQHWTILIDDAEDEIVVDRVLPRAPGGACSNLSGSLGETVGCTIYDRRPNVCRDFDAGSDRCHEYRRMYGFEPQLSEDDMKLGLRKLQSQSDPDRIEDVSIVSVGKIERSSFCVATGEASSTVAEQLSIIVFLSDETPHVLHTFESGVEHWLESDFLGLTVAEAENCIKAQTSW